MRIIPTLFFAGSAEEALAYYADALDGTTEIQRFAGSPAADFATPAAWRHLGDGRAARRAGEPGDNFAISVELEDETRATTIFTKLAAGGSISMPWEQTFFAKKFGMAIDKFGIRWMVRVSDAAPV